MPMLRCLARRVRSAWLNSTGGGAAAAASAATSTCAALEEWKEREDEGAPAAKRRGAEYMHRLEDDDGEIEAATGALRDIATPLAERRASRPAPTLLPATIRALILMTNEEEQHEESRCPAPHFPAAPGERPLQKSPPLLMSARASHASEAPGPVHTRTKKSRERQCRTMPISSPSHSTSMSGHIVQAAKHQLHSAFAALDDPAIPWKTLVLYLIVGVWAFETYLSLRQYKVSASRGNPAIDGRSADA